MIADIIKVDSEYVIPVLIYIFANNVIPILYQRRVNYVKIASTSISVQYTVYTTAKHKQLLIA